MSHTEAVHGSSIITYVYIYLQAEEVDINFVGRVVVYQKLALITFLVVMHCFRLHI